MTIDELAWLSLRAAYAWMFFYPAIGLVQRWPTTVQTTAVLFKIHPNFFALASVSFMFVGAFMILFGVYGWVAGAGFVAFNLGGAVVHFRLGKQAGSTALSPDASAIDGATARGLSELAVVGNITSGQKNFVLAAVGLFFFLLGTGPRSLVGAAPPFW